MPPDDQTVLHLHRRQSDDGTPDVEVKALGPLEIKDAEKGEVTALVSTFNVVDRDRDVLLTGAIRNGAKVKMSSYGHSAVTEGTAPVGMGAIHVDGDRAVFRGHFFLNTQRGREAFETAKALGADNEWSVGWRKSTAQTAQMTEDWRAKGARNLYSSVDVLEVSPVLLGANQYTGTVTVKEAEDAAVKAAEDEAARVATEQAAEIEAKAAKDAAELKARSFAALADYRKVQRTLQRMRLA